MSVVFFRLLHHLTPSPSPPPFRHVDQTRRTRLFWHVCHVFFIFFLTLPLPFLLPLSDTLLGVCNVSFPLHATNMPVSACPLRSLQADTPATFPPHQNTNVPIWAHWWSSADSPATFPPNQTTTWHQRTHLGTLVVFGFLSSTPTPPSKQTRKRAPYGRVCLSAAYFLSPSPMCPPRHVGFWSLPTLLFFSPPSLLLSHSHSHISHFLFSNITYLSRSDIIKIKMLFY